MNTHADQTRLINIFPTQNNYTVPFSTLMPLVGVTAIVVT